MKTFIKQNVDATPIVDNVFGIASLAKQAKEKIGAENVVDATMGCLYDEDSQLVAFDSVYTHYNEIENRSKAKYASSFTGNNDFKEQVYRWVVQDAICTLKHSVIATPGGSGAVAATMADVLDANQTLVIPEIAWGSYKLMASMNNLKTTTYSLFDENHFNIENFKEVCRNVMKEEGKLLVIINDPCHNPTGYSLSMEEWKAVVEVLNTISQEGPVVLLNDIAYIDFAYDFKTSRRYLETFNDISDNILIVVAFSCSKTLTSYGLRCGAAMIMGQHKESVRQLEIVMEKSARAIWSNIPNAAMDNFVYVTSEGYEAFDKEKSYYVNLLKERSEIFVEEAKACDLIHYPYKEGFFVTLRIEGDELLDKYHQALMDNYIFTVKVTKGIRVALCGLTIEKCRGLAQRMKDVLETII